MNSKVSIIIPAYNAEKYLAETIRSVLDQTHPHWELIIIDDGSKDRTAEIATPFLEDRRIRYFFQENAGVSVARNHGISKASSAFVAFLDADDLWLAENLSLKLMEMEADKTLDFVFSAYTTINEFSEKHSDEVFKGTDLEIFKNRLLWIGEPVPGASSNLLVKKEVLDSGIRFDPKISTGADVDFVLQLSHRHKGKFIDQVTWLYRILGNSMSRNMNVMDHDFNYIYRKVSRDFPLGFGLRSKAFSNMYLVLAGSWWVNGNNKAKGLKYILKSVFRYPPQLFALVKKFRR